MSLKFLKLTHVIKQLQGLAHYNPKKLLQRSRRKVCQLDS